MHRTELYDAMNFLLNGHSATKVVVMLFSPHMISCHDNFQKQNLSKFSQCMTSCHDSPQTNPSKFSVTNKWNRVALQKSGIWLQIEHREIGADCKSIRIDRKLHNDTFTGNHCTSSSKTKMNITRVSAVITHDLVSALTMNQNITIITNGRD